MKFVALLSVFVLFSTTSFSQVGINTTNPQSTLDVNGTMRVTKLNSNVRNTELLAKRIIGIDDEGNFIEVEIAKNLILEDNKIRAIDQINTIGDLEGPINLPIINNLRLILLPGEPNEDKSVIRIKSLLGSSIITGLTPGADGQQIWLYPVDGDMTIFTNSLLSLFGNQIEGSAPTILVKRYEMLQLMYDATRSKWIPMGHKN